MGFELDENGRIADSDPIYNKLDELEELGDYGAMAELISSVPVQERTLKLGFTLASALVNAEDYNGAVTELRRIYPECKEQTDLAQLYYYSGYAVSSLGKNLILGLSLFKEALAADPHDDLGLDLERECRDCAAEIDTQLLKFHEQCERTAADISRLCRESNSGDVFEGHELTARLSFLNVFRNAPGLGAPLELDECLKKPEAADKPLLARWLSEAIGVSDYKSMLDVFRNGRSFNLTAMADDVICFINGKPRFDPAIMDDVSRGAFNTYVMFINCFVEYLPEPGVLAWDIAKRIAVVRFAFAADVISKEECVNTLEDLLTSVKSFDGPEEYLSSLVFGSALAAFDAENANLSAAVRAVDLTMPEIQDCGLPGSVWLIN